MAYHGKSKQINHRTKKVILEKIKREKFSPLCNRKAFQRV
jgi:hypothetical protein